MAELVDSGARRKFDSGAERDIQEGKGRCDLLPLEVVAKIINKDCSESHVLTCISDYVKEGNFDHIYFAVMQFVNNELKTDMSTAILEVSKHYEDGANKYSERNWEKGIPLHCFIDSGVRHYLKFKRGDTDEPHDRAFIWNMLGAIWTHKNKPECIDLPFINITKTSVEV